MFLISTMALLTLLCLSRRILSQQDRPAIRTGFASLYGRFRITPGADTEWFGYLFDTSVAGVEETTLAVDRRERVAGGLDRVSYYDGRLQLT
jgi:hypothetical protein